VLVIQTQNGKEYKLLYSSRNFQSGVAVTGYIIRPDNSKSAEENFDELGDGVYVGVFQHERKTADLFEKCGVMIKENGIPRTFEVVQVIN